MIPRQTLLFADFSFFLHRSVAAAEATFLGFFVVRDGTSHRETVLTVTGDTLQTGTAVKIKIPKVFWKGFGFWAVAAQVLTLAASLIGRYLIRGKSCSICNRNG